MADKVLEAIQTKKLREALESVRKKCQDLEEATNQALMVLNTKQVTQSKEILGGLLIDQKEQNQKKKKEKDSDDDDDDDASKNMWTEDQKDLMRKYMLLKASKYYGGEDRVWQAIENAHEREPDDYFSQDVWNQLSSDPVFLQLFRSGYL